ncbi:LysR family transcriptional regulator [Noviherbaspirillum humi]|uniref:LysR family transcriptional regulator n=1 Tax=Noviherbaspirillum humi TaxID=1688639 RepID=UPI0015963758|nr:LysR family transcriptional regulator [Noviherbaspirillum humi]
MPADMSETDNVRRLKLNLKLWKVFHVVVATGSFAKAADILHITQPAVSYAISQLEESIGITLLRVEGRRSKLTESGKILLERSRGVLREALELEQFAATLRANAQPDLAPLLETSNKQAISEM